MAQKENLGVAQKKKSRCSRKRQTNNKQTTTNLFKVKDASIPTRRKAEEKAGVRWRGCDVELGSSVASRAASHEIVLPVETTKQNNQKSKQNNQKPNKTKTIKTFVLTWQITNNKTKQ